MCAAPRRLVVSYFSTIGNYDYGFYWYFYLDGSIQVEAKATGIVFVGRASPGGEPPRTGDRTGSLRARATSTCSPRDWTSRSTARTTASSRSTPSRIPMGPGNEFGNAFTWTETPLRTRARGAARRRHLGRPRVGGGRAHRRRTDIGKPTAYHLLPQPTALLMADPASTVAARAAFATKHLWATAYDRERTVAERPVPEPPIRAARDCRRTPRRTARSTAKTSCCGTRSVSRTFRAPRTGRSCRWTTPASGSSRTGSWT